MNETINPELEQLVCSLKSDLRFKILQNENPSGFGDGVEYWEFTELESKNLKVIYAKNIIGGSVWDDEISVFHKKKNHVYSNSAYAHLIYKDKKRFPLPPLNELKKHIDENA